MNGDKLIRAKKTAPTRPHPSVPPAEGAEGAEGAGGAESTKTIPGAMTGIADRFRDAVTGRGRHS